MYSILAGNCEQADTDIVGTRNHGVFFLLLLLFCFVFCFVLFLSRKSTQRSTQRKRQNIPRDKEMVTIYQSNELLWTFILSS